MELQAPTCLPRVTYAMADAVVDEFPTTLQPPRWTLSRLLRQYTSAPLRRRRHRILQTHPSRTGSSRNKSTGRCPKLIITQVGTSHFAGRLRASKSIYGTRPCSLPMHSQFATRKPPFRWRNGTTHSAIENAGLRWRNTSRPPARGSSCILHRRVSGNWSRGA